MKMKPTQGISIPRSGHGAVLKVVRNYFGESLVYCDAQGKKRNCGCKTVPCVNPARTFAKNHDFGLPRSPGLPIIRSERYFVQYRSPVRAIVSDYYLYLKNNPEKRERADWERFALRQLSYWNRFIDKWVLHFPVDDCPSLQCSYEALLSAPEARTREILAFLCEAALDDAAVARIMECLAIAPRDRLAAFKYYDPVFFRELEDTASERLAVLALPSYEEEF